MTIFHQNFDNSFGLIMLKILSIATVCLLLSSCGKNLPECADAQVIAMLSSSIIEKENLKHSDKLKFYADIISEDKSTKNENERSCQGQLNASFTDEIINEFKNLNEELENRTGIAFQDVNLKPIKIDVQYKIKRNEINKGIFVESNWKTFSDEIDYTPLNQLKNKEKIIQNIDNIKNIADAEKWLKKEPQHSNVVFETLTDKFKLKLSYCTESFDKEDATFSLWCNFGNDAGEVITYRSVPVDLFSLYLGVLAGGNIPGKTNTIKNVDTLNKIFNTDKTVEFSDSKFSIF